MKIEGFGSLHQPDPKDKKQKVSGKQDKTNEKQPHVSDSINLTNSKKRADDVVYSTEVQKSDGKDYSIKKDISEVKQKSSSGHYDNYEVKKKTSEKLIDSRELSNVVHEYHLSNVSKEILAKTPEIRHEKIAEVKKKIEQGLYNNPENFGIIADKMIKHFGI